MARVQGCEEYAEDSSDEEVGLGLPLPRGVRGRLPQLGCAAQGREESGCCEGPRLWSRRVILGLGIDVCCSVCHRLGRRWGGYDTASPGVCPWGGG